jgi:hypothetical protein
MKNAFAIAIMILTMLIFGVVTTFALVELVKAVNDYDHLKQEIELDVIRRGPSLRISK